MALKSTHSTWEGECRALKAQNRELALQVLASDGQASDAYQEAKALREENERLRAFLSMYDDLREGIRELGVKRKPQIYPTILAMDAARADLRTTVLQKQEGEAKARRADNERLRRAMTAAITFLGAGTPETAKMVLEQALRGAENGD